MCAICVKNEALNKLKLEYIFVALKLILNHAKKLSKMWNSNIKLENWKNSDLKQKYKCKNVIFVLLIKLEKHQ